MRSLALTAVLVLAGFARADSTPPPPVAAPASAKGRLSITVSPPGATITVDGAALAPGAPMPLALEPGIYRVTLLQYPKRAHYAVRVRPGETTDVRHDFAAQPQEAPLVIGVRRDGTFVVDGAPLARDLLEVRLALEKQGAVDPRVVIAADKNVTHAALVALMDLVRQAGIAKVSLAVSPPRESGRTSR